MRIFVDFEIACGHYLPHVADGHKCKRQHGHNYGIRLEVEGPLDPVKGWVVDYDYVKSVWDGGCDALDHRQLNDVPGLENPTCENLALWIWEALKPKLPGLCRITLQETGRAGVIYEGELYASRTLIGIEGQGQAKR